MFATKKRLRNEIDKLYKEIGRLNDRINDVSNDLHRKEALLYKNVNGYAIVEELTCGMFGNVHYKNTLYKNGEELISLPANTTIFISKETSDIIAVQNCNTVLQLTYDLDRKPFLQEIKLIGDIILKDYVKL